LPEKLPLEKAVREIEHGFHSEQQMPLKLKTKKSDWTHSTTSAPDYFDVSNPPCSDKN
jgi:hypothetical protein